MKGLTQQDCDDAGIYEDDTVSPTSTNISQVNSGVKGATHGSNSKSSPSKAIDLETSGAYSDAYGDESFDNYEQDMFDDIDDNDAEKENTHNVANSPIGSSSTRTSTTKVEERPNNGGTPVISSSLPLQALIQSSSPTKTHEAAAAVSNDVHVIKDQSIERTSQLALLKSKRAAKAATAAAAAAATNNSSNAKATGEYKVNNKDKKKSTPAKSMSLSPSELALFGIKDGVDALQAIAVSAPAVHDTTITKNKGKISMYFV